MRHHPLMPAVLTALCCLTVCAASHADDVPLVMRDAPLRDLATERVIDASAFDLVPGTQENSLPALRKLVDSLAQVAVPVTVRFRKGTYYFSDSRRKHNAVFLLRDLSDIVFDGAGSEFIVCSPHVKFSDVRDCRRIIFRDFVVDGDPLPFTQGTVTKVDGDLGNFEVKLDEGYPVLTVENFEQKGLMSRRWGMLKDPRIPGRSKFGCPNFFRVKMKVDRTGPRTYRLVLKRKGQIGFFEVGDRYAQLVEGATPGNYVRSCEDITWDRVTLYCGHVSYTAVRSRNINILSCRTLLKGDRLVSTSADGIHFQACENGPWVEDSIFEGISDDGINLYQKNMFVKSVTGGNRLLMNHFGAHYTAGDTLTFFDPVEGRILARLKVTSASRSGEGVDTVLDGEVPEIRCGFFWKRAEPEGAGKRSTHVYSEKYLCGRAVIRNCVFRNGRNIALKLQCHDVLLENTLIEGFDRDGVFIRNLVDYPEGFLGDNFIVRGNLIRDCGFNVNRAPGISFVFQSLGRKPSPVAEMKNILIADNLVVNPGTWAVHGASFANAHIENNTFAYTRSYTKAPPGALSLHNAPGSSSAGNVTYRAVADVPAQAASTDGTVTSRDNTVIDDVGSEAASRLEAAWRRKHERK